MCFSSDGKFLATGSDDKLIRIWDIAKKYIRNTFEGHQHQIHSLSFALDDQLVVSGSYDRTVRIWDIHDGTSKVFTTNDPDSLYNNLGVTSIAISPNGLLVASGWTDAIVRIWNVQTGMLVEELKGHRTEVHSVTFTPDEKGLVSGGLDGLKYWDVRELAVGGTGKGRKDASPVASSSSNKQDDKSVVVLAGGHSVEENSSGTSTCIMNFTGPNDYMASVAVSHDGQWVVSGSRNQGVHFWDAHTAILQCTLREHGYGVNSVDLSPAGNVLATISGDCQARIWSYNAI